MPCCIVFILDTSGSMSTRAHANFSFFEVAKNYIETFIKGRAKIEGRQAPRDATQGRDGDRYFLVTTTAKYPENVKVLGEKSPSCILEELKKLPMPVGSLPIHHALLDSFRLMHVNRTMTGIDAYGSGRSPQYTEQVILILLTDGSGVGSIPNDFKLVFEPPFLGSEMTKEAFRWDQKLYAVVFRMPSTPYKPTTSQLINIDIDVPNIDKLCTATGGRSFSIVSQRQVNTSIDHMLAVIQHHRIGVRFDCLNTIAGKQTSEEITKTRTRFKRILEKKPVTNLISRITPIGRPVGCHWQIPENYFPIKNQDSLPPRVSHPMILLATEATKLNLRNDLPFDKLEIEPGGVTEIVMEMLAGRKEYAVLAYMTNSSNNGGSNLPFACLRLTTNGMGVNFILMPFNFPTLYMLIDELQDPTVVANPQWRARLDGYLASVPFYCLNTTRSALEKFKVKVDVNGSMSQTYAPSLITNLNRLKLKGKEEYDNAAIALKASDAKQASTSLITRIRIERITSRSAILGLVRPDEAPPPDVKVENEEYDPPELVPIVSGDFQIPLYPPVVSEPALDTVYRSPFNSSIMDIISKLHKMQANCDMLYDSSYVCLLDMAKPGVKARFNNLEELHNLPLKTMGEYEPYQMAALKVAGGLMRKIEEDKERTHAFGNPYKIKNFGAGIDEVMDSAVVDASKRDRREEGRGGPPKRKRGPLGIDAFDKWRARRSLIGSEVSSEVSNIEDLMEDLTPSTSNGNSLPGTIDGLEGEPTEGSRFEDNLDDVIHIMDGEIKGNAGKMKKVPKTVNGRSRTATMSRAVEVIEVLTPDQMRSRKMLIASIVRQTNYQRAFEEILATTVGISRECCSTLIRFAIRESSRFKVRTLTEKLELRLKNDGGVLA